MPFTDQYSIEASVYKIPVPMPDWLAWLLKGIMPTDIGHLFLCLIKHSADNKSIAIAALHGLATHITHDQDSGQNKSVLPIGKGPEDFTVLYHMVNYRDYLPQIDQIKNDASLEEAEKESLIEKIQKEIIQNKEIIGLSDAEDKENFESFKSITRGNPEWYWLTQHKKEVIYDASEGADNVLQKWHLLNSFKEDYNKDPKHYPAYGLGWHSFLGGKPLNSNAACTTFEYVLGKVATGFPGFWTPGLGGRLWSSDKLEQWRQSHSQAATIASSSHHPEVSTSTDVEFFNPNNNNSSTFRRA